MEPEPNKDGQLTTKFRICKILCVDEEFITIKWSGRDGLIESISRRQIRRIEEHLGEFIDIPRNEDEWLDEKQKTN